MSGIKEIQNPVVNFLGGIDKPETNQRSQNKNGVTATSLPASAEWLEPISGKIVNPVNVQKTESPEEKFWVKLPSAETPKDQVSKKIRENLLRDEFGFDEKDLAAYIEKNGDKGFVIYNEKCEIWATDDEVKTWKTAEEKVEITVPKDKADELRGFRVGRVLDKSLEGIEDKNLRATVKTDLLKLLKAEGKDKISAAERLLNLGAGGNDLKTIRDAIRTLSEQPEARDSGVIQIVAAKMKLADTFQSQDEIQKMFDVASRKDIPFVEKITGDLNNGGIFDSNIKNNSAEIVSPMSKVKDRAFQNTQVDRNRVSDFKLSLERATLAAGGFDKVSGTPNPRANVNRDEAAWVNQQAADTYRAIGDTAEADKREMMVRRVRLMSGIIWKR